MADQTEEQHESLAGPIAFAAVYTVVYILVHVAVSVMTPGLVPEGERDNFYYYLGPFSIGISSGLMTLSMGVGLQEGIRHFGAIAPTSLFKLFSIYVIGQTLVLIAGHIEIYAPLVASEPQQGLLGALIANLANLMGFLTLSLAIAVLIVMEVYVAGVYANISKRVETLAARQQDKAFHLMLLASASLVMLVLCEIVSRFYPNAKEALKVFLIAIEIIIAFATFAATAGLDRFRRRKA